MVAKFNEKMAQIPSANSEATPLTKHQIVVLASIIEKETGAPEERPLISSVFHNRIRKGMRLQTDPTVIYGVWTRTGSWNRNISRQDLVTPTPYNTYVIPGLPPGPIANAGWEAPRCRRSAGAVRVFIFCFSQRWNACFFKRLSTA
jgi:UPF0755 protein